VEHRRLTLDNPVFAGTLRYSHRSVAYVRRPPVIVDVNRPQSKRGPAKSQAVAVPLEPAKAPTARQSQSKLQRAAPVLKSEHLVSTPAGASAPVEAAPLQKTEARPTSHRLRLKLPDRRMALLYGMAVIVFGAGVFVAVNGFHTNQQVAAQVKGQQKQTNASVADHVVPTTEKPSSSVVRTYTVAPNVPKYVDIPKLGVHARVLSEGVTKSGALQVPWNIYDTGWYNASAQPGQNGATLIDGHSGIGKTHGVFWRLASLTTGDRITITRGDNQQFTYSVVKVQTVDVNSVDMNSMLVSADTSKPGLNLITCTGDVIPGTESLNKRVQVYAVLQ